jgi:hypothetical protein
MAEYGIDNAMQSVFVLSGGYRSSPVNFLMG